MAWKANISRKKIGVVTLALLLPTLTAAGLYAYYPAPNSLLEEMWIVRTDLLKGVRGNDPQHSLAAAQKWKSLVTRLETGVWLRKGPLNAELKDRIANLQEVLDDLEEALANGKTEEVHSLTAECFEAHRQIAAAFQITPNVVQTSEGHEGHKHAIYDIPEGEPVPSVKLTAINDPKAGWNLHIEAEDFRFSPENAGKKHVPGEGHGHLYIDGKKVGRLYGEWHYLSHLPPGTHVVKVTLNTNNHDDYAHQEIPVAAETTIEVPQYDELAYFGTTSPRRVRMKKSLSGDKDICLPPGKNVSPGKGL